MSQYVFTARAVLCKPLSRESWADGCHPGKRCAHSCTDLKSRAKRMWEYVAGSKGFGQEGGDLKGSEEIS